MTVGQARVEVADDEHAARRHVAAACVHVHRAGGRAAAGADRRRSPATPALPSGAAHARPSSSRRKRAGSGPPGRLGRAAAWTNEHAPLDRGDELVEVEVAHVVVAAQQADVDQPAAELPRRPGHQLLDPADPQAQRLADDGRAVGRRRSGGVVDGRRAGEHLHPRRRTDARRDERQHDRVALDELVQRHVLGVRLGERREGQRGTGHRRLAGAPG